MTAEPTTAPWLEAAYREADAAITDHAGSCPVCTGGCVCTAADAAFTDEYRAYAEWRTADPVAARASQPSQEDIR